MKKAGFLIVLGVLVYTLSLVINFPARIAYGLAQDFLPASVRLFGLEGSLFKGSGKAVLMDSVPVREVNWAFEPTELLMGRISFLLQLRFDGGRIASSVAADPLMRISLFDVSGDLPLELLQSTSPQGALVYGRLVPAIERLTIKNGVVSRAKGRVAAKAVSYRRDGVLPLGDFVAGVDAEGAPVAVGIADSGGPLRLNGQLVLAGDGSYQLEAMAGARESSPELVNLLAQIGTPNQDGQYAIQLEGRIR